MRLVLNYARLFSFAAVLGLMVTGSGCGSSDSGTDSDAVTPSSDLGDAGSSDLDLSDDGDAGDVESGSELGGGAEVPDLGDDAAPADEGDAPATEGDAPAAEADAPAADGDAPAKEE